MSGGKDVISRADVTDPRMQFMFDRFAQQAGVTNGQLTRQQFLDTMQQRMGQFGGGRGGAPTGNNANAPAGNNSWIESSFRRLDQNGDGLLNYDEMSEALKTERDKWDTNKDGFIDLAEYRAYAVARMQAERGAAGRGVEEDPAVIVADPAPAEEEEKRPVAYRVGKLPKELPAWFSQLDTDGDAQIGLYEWRNSGRAIEEFEKIDRNGDGFLTVDEVLRYTRVSGGVTQTPGSESQENVASNQPRVSPPGGGSTFGRGGPGGGPSAWRGGDSGGSSSSWRGGGPGGRWNRGDGGGGRSNRSRNNQEGNSEGGQRRRDRGSGSSRGDRNSQPSEQS
jgi:Ca2+-binding EF-hand superfamily protein